ncbi:MAG: carbon storage regulator [Planctomycetales bacterium]|nr:carbon storage regulator [Planctomycetales bacterium]MCA9181346.1 carbon storage regulator [Planctomycetales bacterium]
MLVLSRKLNQTIRIGDSISVSVLRIKGNVIQLGIEAPRDVHVVRSELIERDSKQAEQPVEHQMQKGGAVRPPNSGGDHSKNENESDAALGLFTALRIVSESPPRLRTNTTPRSQAT